MSTQRKAILSVMLIIVVLSGVFFAQTARFHKRRLRDVIRQNIDEAKLLTRSNLSAARELHRVELKDVTSRHPDILVAFDGRHRQQLYEATRPLFEALRQQHPGLTNMHFHLPDGRSFLRMHRPDEHGDDLTVIRPMIAQIHRDQIGCDGYEFGVHSFLYRVAVPVMHEDRYLGAVEFGIRPEHLISEIGTILGVEIALFAHPAHSRSKDSSDGRRAPDRQSPVWASDPDSILATLPTGRIGSSGAHEIRTSKGRFCVYRAGEVTDCHGAGVGYLFIAQNIDALTAEYRRFVLVSLLATAGLVGAAFLILRVSFGCMIQRIVYLNKNLERQVRERTEALRGEKKRAEAATAELSQIFETAVGGLRVIDKDFRIVRANRRFREMARTSEAETIGRLCHEVLPGQFCHTEYCTLRRILNGEERVELELDKTRPDGATMSCFLSATPWRSPDGDLLGIIEDFRGIATIRKLLEQQTINISLAQRVLDLINAPCLRQVDLSDSTALFVHALYSTCNAAGGDHYFVRHLRPTRHHPAGRTVISLKDQSGHEVNCVLKSIVTDLIHNAVLHSSKCPDLESEITRLNRRLLASSLFAPDEFVTAMTLEIDHASSMLKYVSCGHPAFLLIRTDGVLAFPEDAGTGRHLPLGIDGNVEFTAGEVALQAGDRLVVYTDGLTEMTVPSLKKRVTVAGLKNIVNGILAAEPSMPVSLIIQKMLDIISQMSHEQVIPCIANTSGDDVTVLGLEVERQGAEVEHVLRIDSAEPLCECVVRFTEEIHTQAREHGFELSAHQVRAVLDEALSNAWKHGNGGDAEKSVTLRWWFGNDMHIEVVDEGQGFDYRRVDDPREGDGLFGESGRGIFIMRLYADHVCWKDGGRRIVLTFHRQIGPDRRRKRRVQKADCLDIWRLDSETSVASPAAEDARD